MNHRQYQFSMVVSLTPVVKKLIIINVALWVVLVLIAQKFMPESYIFQWFGMTPMKVMTSLTLWQPFTYMFIHSYGVMHVLFNMLLLWWLGAELEQRWGGRFFLTYYIVCGIGSAIIYLLCLFIYYALTKNFTPLNSPVIGASGAVFGLILAYGIIFSERVIYFMMIFPMKAKYFVMILGGIEVLTLLNSGVDGDVANLAHLGGLVAGFLFLGGWTRYKGSKVRKRSKKHGRKLKLVVDNEGDRSDQGPKYWN